MKMQPRGTDGSLLASLPWTLGALCISLLPHVIYLPIWITAAFAGCALWRYVIERRRKMLPSSWVRGGLALLCFLGVLGTYSSISGVGPGSALLAVMAALKLLETRKRRDQFVLLFISIFLVMSALLREQYLWSLPYLVVAVLFIMTAWLRMSAGNTEATRQSIATGSRLMLYAAPLAIAMWIFFPRLASPFWGVPIDTSQATTGLSDSMSPGDISSLSKSNAVAFRVKFDGDVPAPRDRYWRALVMTNFTGRTWNAFSPTIAGAAKQQIEPRGEPIRYEITMEPNRQQWVFSLDMPMEWSNRKTFMGPEQQLWRETPIQQRFAYRVVSYPEYFVKSQPRSRNWYTRIPEDGNDRTRGLAASMLKSAGSETAFIEDVMKKFNTEEYFYTLQPPTLGSDPIDRFLFDTRRGFCEHYASAFAFMMRSVGIPSRIVAGYQGGEINPMGGHLIVRQSDAHVWVEVWLEEYGWYRVDPTAAVAPERIEYGTRDPSMESLASGWGFSAPSQFIQNVVLTWDVLNAKWNDWILGYGPDKQNSFMRWLGMADPNWRSMMLTLVTLLITLLVGVSGLLMLRYRRPSKDEAEKLYERFVRATGLQRRTGESAQQFSVRAAENSELPGAWLHDVTTHYLRCRYGVDGDRHLATLETLVSSRP